MSDATTGATETAVFAYELGHLKMVSRSGWRRIGIGDGENVAAHSWRAAVLAFVIAVGEGADPERAAVLGLFHDVPEARYGDVDAVGKPYVKTVPATEVAADQTSSLPVELAERIRGAIAEHESSKRPGASKEAMCSRDADKLELLLTAREYQEAGRAPKSIGRYIESMIPMITTATGQALRDAALHTDPSAWWDDFATRFGTPAASERPFKVAK
ncbi:HD family hydrolase [Nocardia sp. NPDC059240]|uniref:HD domain-containing protein n=1 Tax=Nocardia sp. NPDC059240 TaxID=3346786 RepID=UPI00368E8046